MKRAFVALDTQSTKSLKSDAPRNPLNSTVTVTFGDVGESHVGMQKIGTLADRGFSPDNVCDAKIYFEKMGCECILVNLNDFLPETEAWDLKMKTMKDQHIGIPALEEAKTSPDYNAIVLIVKIGMSALGDSHGSLLKKELLDFTWDDAYYDWKQKKVKNKRARKNLNFSDTHQVSDFERGKGTTIAWNEAPILKTVRERLHEALGEEDLIAEGNLYHEHLVSGIGYHGDSERRKVIGVRLGATMPMAWNWYYNNEPVGKNIHVLLETGDIYIMSEKAVGTDWLSPPKKHFSLRHAAGGPKYTKTHSTKSDKLNIKNQESQGPLFVGEVWFKRDKDKTWEEGGTKQV